MYCILNSTSLFLLSGPWMINKLRCDFWRVVWETLVILISPEQNKQTNKTQNKQKPLEDLKWDRKPTQTKDHHIGIEEQSDNLSYNRLFPFFFFGIAIANLQWKYSPAQLQTKSAFLHWYISYLILTDNKDVHFLTHIDTWFLLLSDSLAIVMRLSWGFSSI